MILKKIKEDMKTDKLNKLENCLNNMEVKSFIGFVTFLKVYLVEMLIKE